MYNYYTILDENNDRFTWSYDKNTASAYYGYNMYNDADDWLISPPINYKGGKEYVLKFKAYSSLSSYLESMEVKFGDERTPEGQNRFCLIFRQYRRWTRIIRDTIRGSVHGRPRRGFTLLQFPCQHREVSRIPVHIRYKSGGKERVAPYPLSASATIRVAVKSRSPGFICMLQSCGEEYISLPRCQRQTGVADCRHQFGTSSASGHISQVNTGHRFVRLQYFRD